MEWKKLFSQYPSPFRPDSPEFDRIPANTLGIIGCRINGDELYVYTYTPERKLTYTLICNARDDIFKTYDHNAKKWRDSMIDRLLGIYIYSTDYKRFAYLDEMSRVCGGLYFGFNNRESMPSIVEWQSGLRSRQLMEQTERDRKHIDALMELAEDLPREINKFIENTVMRDDHFVFYHKEKGVLKGFCDHCRNDVEIKHPIKGNVMDKSGFCPRCHVPVTFKHDTQSASFVTSAYFQYLCAIPDGIMITGYKVMRWHDREKGRELKQKILQENRMAFSYSGKKSCYTYGDHHKAYENGSLWYRFEPRKSYYGDYSELYIDCPVYPGNLSKLLAPTPWKWSGLAEYAKCGSAVDVTEWFFRASYKPVLEKLAKVGLYHLSMALAEKNYSDGLFSSDASTLTAAMGVDRADVRMCAKIDIYPYELVTLRKMRCLHRPFTERDILDIRKTDVADIMPERFCQLILCRLSVYRAMKYIREQYKLDQKLMKKDRHYGCAGDVIRDWCDYAEDCEKLEYDLGTLNVICPGSLNAAHDGAALAIKAKETEIQRRQFNKIVPDLEAKYCYSDDKYLVRVAKTPVELITEGKLMGHCVGRYIDRMAQGESIILFVRSVLSPEEPLATAEIRESSNGRASVVQIRAKHNAVPGKDVLSFWDKYKKDVLSKAKKQNDQKLKVAV